MFLDQKIHFIGIGGIGMSPIAKILFQKGFKISGSDKSENLIVKDLKRKGVRIFKNHSSSNISDVDIIVYSSAINKSNVELVEAKKRNITTISRGKALGEFTKNKKNICITGTHGKSTSTSFISQILI